MKCRFLIAIKLQKQIYSFRWHDLNHNHGSYLPFSTNPVAILGREVGSKVPTGGGYFLGSLMGKKKIIQLIPKGQFFFYNAPKATMCLLRMDELEEAPLLGKVSWGRRNIYSGHPKPFEPPTLEYGSIGTA